MGRPLQEVSVFGIQDRRATERVKLPWVARYVIDGRHRSKSFRTRAEAERYRSLLLQAVHAGERFDVDIGEPESWKAPLGEEHLHVWARRWIEEQWGEWAPRTRASAVEAITRLVVVSIELTSDVPDRRRHYIWKSMPPTARDQRSDGEEMWLARHTPRLGELDRTTIASIERNLMLKLDGTPLAVSTQNRFRTNARACVLAAADAGAFSADVWPTRTRSRRRRKTARMKKGVDMRRLPTPETMERAIAAIDSSNPSSRTYRMMTAVAYYGGLRPSEVVMLRRRSLALPEIGWGRIDVTEADVSFDEPGEPKTGPRSVPIPPVLVQQLTNWLADRAIAEPDQLLFRTRTNTRPSGSNWGRAWHRALTSIGHPPLRVYDCRHAAATTWLRAGMPLGEAARRLGHSVDTLVNNYVGALSDDEAAWNDRLDTYLNKIPTSPSIASR